MKQDPTDHDQPDRGAEHAASDVAESDVSESDGAGPDTRAKPATQEPQAVPEPRPEAAICPYCGEASTTLQRCSSCAGRFDPLSRQVSQNQMGPWSVRNSARPHHPGCSYATLKKLIERGRVDGGSVIRGPSTHQFWMRADRVPGVAHLMGVCHACGEEARADAFSCDACGAPFVIDQDRQHLGLMPTRLLPGEAPARVVATAATPVPNAPGGKAGEAPGPVPERPFPERPGRVASADGAPGPGGHREPALSAGAVSPADRRARSLRRQNAALMTACAVLSAVLVLLIGAVAMGGGEIVPATAHEGGNPDGESGTRSSTLGAGGIDPDALPGDARAVGSGQPVDETVGRLALVPGGGVTVAEPDQDAGTEPEPTLVKRLSVLLTRRGPGDLEEAAALIRATENDPALRAEVQSLLAVLRQQRGLPALRRLP